MDEATTQKYVNILRNAQRLDLSDPAGLANAKKILQFANSLKPKEAQLPQALRAELLRFYDSVGARPEVAGVKTTVQGGNKWEARNPPMPPLGKRK